MNIWLPAAFMGGFSIVGGAPQAAFRTEHGSESMKNGPDAAEIEAFG